MANITMDVTSDDYEVVIDEDRLQRMKEIINEQLEKAPNGFESIVDDVYTETLRRVLEKSLPKTPPLLTSGGSVYLEGPRGVLSFFINYDYWWTPLEEQTLVDAMIVICAHFMGVTIDGQESFLEQGLITEQEGEYYTDALAKAVLRSLSGQEQGY